jgi:hypothetical protein
MRCFNLLNHCSCVQTRDGIFDECWRYAIKCLDGFIVMTQIALAFFCANSLIFVSFFFLSKFVLGILSVVGRRAAASWCDICIHLLGVNG